jgi:hypothetical protein
MCLKYAQLETKLGEVDRARGVFSHGSQMSDPRTAKSYWKAWQEFEVRHGNEDTFREMLRIKRSVQAQYNTQVCYWVTPSVSTQVCKVVNRAVCMLMYLNLGLLHNVYTEAWHNVCYYSILIAYNPFTWNMQQ